MIYLKADFLTTDNSSVQIPSATIIAINDNLIGNEDFTACNLATTQLTSLLAVTLHTEKY
ncbi:MAG: hypothetical protein K2Q32_00800 [Alphaproteobacteria bacterium]|nr:hypothetical protein [Alphaproteobacteria bacterium]